MRSMACNDHAGTQGYPGADTPTQARSPHPAYKAASAGVAIPPAENSGTASDRPLSPYSATQTGPAISRAIVHQLLLIGIHNRADLP